MGLRAQPLIAVRDIATSRAWYENVLGLRGEHGGDEYERLRCDGKLVLQLHRLDCGHHHGVIGDANEILGNGVAIWFETDALDEIEARAGEHVQTPRHWNPNALHDEIWLRDPDGYLVVVASATADERWSTDVPSQG